MQETQFKKSVLLTLGVLANALLPSGNSVATAQTAAQNPVTSNEGSAQSVTAANLASISAIEQSYVSVPHLCKARSAAFDPIQLPSSQITAELAAFVSVHELLDVQGSGVV